MKSKVMGIASIAAVVLTVVGLALGSTFARASNQDIVDTAVGAGQFKTLAAALGAAGLVETLKGPGPFTVFAPTDAAFAKLPAGTVEEPAEAGEQGKAGAILTYHVVPGAVKAEQVTKLRRGQDRQRRDGEGLHRTRQGDDQRRTGRDARYRGLERRHPRHRHGHPAARELIGPLVPQADQPPVRFRPREAGRHFPKKHQL